MHACVFCSHVSASNCHVNATVSAVVTQVTDALTGKPAVDAEVTVLVVDEAILALLPYPLPVSSSINSVQ
jgi:hypothetical protein